MLIFNCTKAAAEFFSISRHPQQPPEQQSVLEQAIDEVGSPAQPVSPWLIHLVKIKRRNVLVAMHVQSRYAMVFNGISKGDRASLQTQLVSRLMQQMRMLLAMVDAAGTSEASVKQIAMQFHAVHQQTIFCQRGDRSVQSHLNDVVWQFDWHSQRHGGVPEADGLALFDVWINRQIRQSKQQDWFFPDEEMLLHWLHYYGQVATADLEAIRGRLAVMRYGLYGPDAVEEPKAPIAKTPIRLVSERRAAVLPDNVIDMADWRRRHRS